jgi:Putative peptidoglycan binding domain/Lysine-specific metallo-endopeptidase
VGRWGWFHPGYRWPWFDRGIRVEGWAPSPVVAWAQGCLSQLLGTGLPQDGIIGPDTRQAIASFQAQQQLPPTGMLDDNTVSALQAACGAQQESDFGRDAREYQEFADEAFEERDVGVSGSGGTGRMVDPAKVDCDRLDRSLPIFRAIGTTDPVGVLEAVCQRAVEMLDNVITELTRIRERVIAGDPPAFPLISDALGWSLQTRMLMRVDDAAAWTGSGPRTAEQIIRWLTNIRKTIAGGELRYVCLASGCKSNSRAFSFPDRSIIGLCRLFWQPKPGTDAATHRDFQAQTIINRVSHIYYGTTRTGRGPGSAYCINQFVADANGAPIRPEDIGRCGAGAPTLHHEAEYEESYDVDEPEWPQWPPSSQFNPPPPQIVPTGPFQTHLCQAILDDWGELLFAVEELKTLLRKRPPNPALVDNRSDIVRALNRKIVARLRKRTYVQQGCTQHDLRAFADSVQALRGPGVDSDTGSWPPATTARTQEARRAARESTQHLLNWARRAATLFPRI